MTLKEHKKHSDLARPAYGNFGRHEWAIVGTECNKIKALADDVIKELSASYKCAYVDAQHKDENKETVLPGRLANGAVTEYTDHIQYQQFNFHQPLNSFQYHGLLNDADLVLINGNHHEAKAQVVVIDPNKKTSLQKRVSQLTHVELILLADNTNEIFDFVKEAIPSWQHLPVYRMDEKDKIIQFFQRKLQEVKPLLNGLVLAGGKSVRMGTDKGLITWHGKEQRYYIADLLKDFCKDVFISCRAEQKQEIDAHYKVLEDTFIGLGPYGALLSAFREQPDSAWLVVACDLPLLNKETLLNLIQHRNVSSIATTFISPHDSLPEPLITIWEPKSYPVLLSFLAQGYSCPRKVLRNNNVTLLEAPDADTLINVNTPEESEKVKNILQQKIAVP